MADKSVSDIVEKFGKGRPIFRLFFFADQDEHIVHIDTGCDWEMVMELTRADELGLVRTEDYENATIASGRTHAFEVRSADILWFGARRKIRVHIPIESDQPNRKPLQRRGVTPDDAPVAVVGIALLVGTTLNINFVSNTLRITHEDNATAFP